MMIYLDAPAGTAEVSTALNAPLYKEGAPVPAGKKSPDKTYCPYCGHESILIWVHGHYQCSRCKYVVVSCCESN
jgi:ribosomal protein S27AE